MSTNAPSLLDQDANAEEEIDLTVLDMEDPSDLDIVAVEETGASGSFLLSPPDSVSEKNHVSGDILKEPPPDNRVATEEKRAPSSSPQVAVAKPAASAPVVSTAANASPQTRQEVEMADLAGKAVTSSAPVGNATIQEAPKVEMSKPSVAPIVPPTAAPQQQSTSSKMETTTAPFSLRIFSPESFKPLSLSAPASRDEWDEGDEEQDEEMSEAYEPNTPASQTSGTTAGGITPAPHAAATPLTASSSAPFHASATSLNPHHRHYHPYLLPTDETVEDARVRLHTALEQTRILRETFTHRLWDKYNILLQPVESSIEQIVERCHQPDARDQIQRLQNIWSWEKRIEGVLDPPLVPMTIGSSALPSGAGGGSGGFSSIVLPEDGEYSHIAAGAKARHDKRISGASAAAAKVILDRARTNAVARRVVYRDLKRGDRDKYGSSGPIAVTLSQADVDRAKAGGLDDVNRGRELVAHVPRGGAVQLQPNTNVGVMGSEVLLGAASAGVTVVQGSIEPVTKRVDATSTAVKIAPVPAVVRPKAPVIAPVAVRKLAPALPAPSDSSVSSSIVVPKTTIPASAGKSASAGLTAPRSRPAQRNAYGADLSLDEAMILFHKSSQNYRTRMRHRSVPPLIATWSSSTCRDSVFSDRAVRGYVTARMGLRDSYIRKHLLPKSAAPLQRGAQALTSRLEIDATGASTNLPAPWKWVEGAPTIVVKEGTCITCRDEKDKDGADRAISGIGQVLSLFYQPTPLSIPSDYGKNEARNEQGDNQLPASVAPEASEPTSMDFKQMGTERDDSGMSKTSEASLGESLAHSSSTEPPPAQASSTAQGARVQYTRQNATLTDERLRYKRQNATLRDDSSVAISETADETGKVGLVLQRQNATVLDERLLYSRQDATLEDESCSVDDECRKMHSQVPRCPPQASSVSNTSEVDVPMVKHSVPLKDSRSSTVEMGQRNQRSKASATPKSGDLNANKQDNSSLPISMNIVALAHSMHFVLSKRDGASSKSPGDEEKECATPSSQPSFDPATVYSVLAALGVVRAQDDSPSSSHACNPTISMGHTPMPLAPPKFLEGQRVEALWQSPHEAQFSGCPSTATTPYNSDVEDIARTKGAGIALGKPVDEHLKLLGLASKGSWYPAAITRVVFKPHLVEGLDVGPEGSDYRYDVAYDDGDVDEGLKVYQIRSRIDASDGKENARDSLTRAEVAVKRSGKAEDETTAIMEKNRDKLGSGAGKRASKAIVDSYRFMEALASRVCSGVSALQSDSANVHDVADLKVVNVGRDGEIEAPRVTNEGGRCAKEGGDVIGTSGKSTTSPVQYDGIAETSASLDIGRMPSRPKPPSVQDGCCPAIEQSNVSEDRSGPQVKKARVDTSSFMPSQSRHDGSAISSASMVRREKLASHEASSSSSVASDYPLEEFLPGSSDDLEPTPIPDSAAAQHFAAEIDYTNSSLYASIPSVTDVADSFATSAGNFGLPFWRQVGNGAELDPSFQLHASSMASPSSFLMCPQEQAGRASTGYSHLSQLQGSALSRIAGAAILEQPRASSLAASHLIYNTTTDFAMGRSASGQLVPLGISSAATGITDAYASALALANKSHGISAWERAASLQNAYQGEPHSFLVGGVDAARRAAMLCGHRGLMTLPATHNQAHAAQMQLLMSSATRWTPRPHTAHSFSPRITGSSLAMNPSLVVPPVTGLRPSSAGPLRSSQSLAAGIAAPRDYLMDAMLTQGGTVSSRAYATHPSSWHLHSGAVDLQPSTRSSNFSSTETALEAVPRPADATEIETKRSIDSLQTCNVPGSGSAKQCRPNSAPETRGSSSSAAASSLLRPRIVDDCSMSAEGIQEQCLNKAFKNVPKGSSGEKNTKVSCEDSGGCGPASTLSEQCDDDNSTPRVELSRPSGGEEGFQSTDDLSTGNAEVVIASSKVLSNPELSDVDQKSSAGENTTSLPPPELELRCKFPPPSAESLLAKDYPDLVELIVVGKFPHQLGVFLSQRRLALSDASREGKNAPMDQNVIDRIEKAAADYLLQAANAVPIAKTWVGNEIKKKWEKFPPLSTFGICGSGSISTIREVVSAVVSLWVWHHYQPVFQRAFASKGRVDVDNECKFLVETCVECCLLGIAKAVASMGSPAVTPPSCGLNAATTAGIASYALEASVSLSSEVDGLLIPSTLEAVLVDLDKRRFKALQLMVYERALLTAFVARTFSMTERYAYAYVKYMLVVGETLGHAKVCQLVHDDTLHDPGIGASDMIAPTTSTPNFGSVWTLLPFDVVRSEDDEFGYVFEDPCKPRYGGFTQGMDKDELMSRAHAKALIQRCLYKLQQKHGFQGGTSSMGPYEDHENADGNSSTKGGADSSVASIKHIPPSVAGFGVPMVASGPGTPRGVHPAMKRKSSFTGREIDATGGASHVGALMYPAHYCAPLVVHSHDVNCMPYGKHSRVRFTSSDADEDLPLQKKSRLSTTPMSASMVRSTEPIDWGEIAKLFVPVAVPDPTAPVAPGESITHIFAPDVRRLDKPAWEESGGESDSDDNISLEDISDEAVLARHQKVLDLMKQKLDVAMEQRSVGRVRTMTTGTVGRAIR